MKQMSGFRYDYLLLFRREKFWLRDQVQALEPIEDFPTIVASYDAEIRKAIDVINSHFKSAVPAHPLNCLLLGPPGAGKTFLARKLAGKTCGKEDVAKINCAHFASADELRRELSRVVAGGDENKIVLVDECDVTISGSSAMRYLIDPMYDGRDSDGNEFKKTVFLFCGSYLRNQEIKHQIEDRASSLSVPALLHDFMLEALPEEREMLRDGFLASCMLSEFRERTAPTGNVVRYLRRLEKLNDFLSRINGPVIEIPDVSRPLDVSTPHFVISSGRDPGHPEREDDSEKSHFLEEVRLGKSCSPQRLIRFVKDTELPHLPAGRKHVFGTDERFRFFFKYAWDAFLAFKNMMIIERLLRVCDMIKTRKLDGEGNFQMRADELNFLSLVPVVHGLRSVETIVIRLLDVEKKAGNNRVFFRGDQFDMIVRSQIVDDRLFSHPSHVWDWTVQSNHKALCKFGKTTPIRGDQMIELMI